MTDDKNLNPHETEPATSKPDGSTTEGQDFQNPETEEDTASGGPAD